MEGKNEKVHAYYFGCDLLLRLFYYTDLLELNSDVDRLTAELQRYENFVNDLRTSAENHTADWIKGLIDKVSLPGNN